MTPNDQKAANLIQEWLRFTSVPAHQDACALERFFTTHIVPKLATPDHEAALAVVRADGRKQGMEEAAKWHDEQDAQLIADADKQTDAGLANACRVAALNHSLHARSIRALKEKAQ